MVGFPGAFGTRGSLVLRLVQAIFSLTSLLIMSWDIEYNTYNAFIFLVAVMGIAISWSLALALVDVYVIFFKRPTHQGLVSLIVGGDWVLSFMSLAAACASASLTDYLMKHHMHVCGVKMCSRSLFSTAITFTYFSLSLTSSIFNFWLLAAL